MGKGSEKSVQNRIKRLKHQYYRYADGSREQEKINLKILTLRNTTNK